jgi:hypothetical protein
MFGSVLAGIGRGFTGQNGACAGFIPHHRKFFLAGNSGTAFAFFCLSHHMKGAGQCSISV